MIVSRQQILDAQPVRQIQMCYPAFPHDVLHYDMRGRSYLYENSRDICLPRVYPRPPCLMPSLSDHGLQGSYCRQCPSFIYLDNPQANFRPQQYQHLQIQHSPVRRESLCTGFETRE